MFLATNPAAAFPVERLVAENLASPVVVLIRSTSSVGVVVDPIAIL